jgi:hypothetical protein
MCHSRNAIHEHLKGIDPKLLKFSAAKKESLAPLLRASKRLLQRKGRCVCVCVCVRERERERERERVCVCARARACVCVCVCVCLVHRYHFWEFGLRVFFKRSLLPP